MAKRALEDDGGHIYGNFHNYYTFRPPNDRLDMFPEGFFAMLVRQSQLAAGLIREGEELLPPCILDIGCNEGDLTAGICDLFVRDLLVQPLALGVDLDAELITRANNKYGDDAKYSGLIFRAHDVMQSGVDDENDPIQSFLRTHNRRHFDVVFCFSTTMWIHLNTGDEGLERFLTLLTRLASALVLEPQDWPAYRRASQRARRRKLPELEQFGVIQHRSDIIEHIQNTLMSEGEEGTRQKFSQVEDLGKGAWKRPLHVYTR